MAAAMSGAARGQTQIDLRTQGKNIDFSSAARTRPSKTGTLVPAVCTIGETFVKTDAAAGKNLYVCTAIERMDRARRRDAGPDGQSEPGAEQ